MLKAFGAAALLLLMPNLASAQSGPSWEDIALQAQRNAAMEQGAALAMISALQTEIAGLKADLAKSRSPPPPPPPQNDETPK